MMADFTENLAGVHVWSPIDGEHTVCGDAFDAPSSEADWEDGPFLPTTKRVVTCRKCQAVILALRGVRTHQDTPHAD